MAIKVVNNEIKLSVLDAAKYVFNKEGFFSSLSAFFKGRVITVEEAQCYVGNRTGTKLSNKLDAFIIRNFNQETESGYSLRQNKNRENLGMETEDKGMQDEELLARFPFSAEGSSNDGFDGLEEDVISEELEHERKRNADLLETKTLLETENAQLKRQGSLSDEVKKEKMERNTRFLKIAYHRLEEELVSIENDISEKEERLAVWREQEAQRK